ncbi:hypothetical protein D9M71_824740 [compost metagenome]
MDLAGHHTEINAIIGDDRGVDLANSGQGQARLHLRRNCGVLVLHWVFSCHPMTFVALGAFIIGEEQRRDGHCYLRLPIAGRHRTP